VVVEIAIRRAEEVCGTWLSVGAAATQLNMACVGTYSLRQFYGGYTFAGSGDGVKITLSYSGGSGNEANGTAAADGTNVA
jgi:hypothetical protein